jgi:phage regulator Rha-like protein
MIVNVASGWINYVISHTIRSWNKPEITDYNFNGTLVRRGISVKQPEIYMNRHIQLADG